ncbi:MAG: glycosyltransferase family 2 protein [Nanoarchaeota archaeon]|nr:glycosyltransferase family 2 protein [Nanoarchaeota archaeon]
MMISFLVPAYNEEKKIVKTLERIIGFAEGYCKKYEVIVVCDGVDGTAKRARSFKKVKVLGFKTRLGKGGALVKGFEASRGEVIVFLDADLSTPPKYVKKLVGALDSSDVVIGSRYLKNSRINIPFKRLIASRGFNFLVRLFTGLNVNDTQSGFKAFKRSALESVFPLRVTGFSFDVELLKKLKGKGFSMKEVPVEWVHDPDSKMTYSKALAMFRDLLRIVVDNE